MIVVDSSFLIGFYNERDAHHPAAARRAARIRLVTFLMARRGHTVAACVGRLLLEASELEFVPCSDLFTETWDRFQRHDLRLSFADAAIANFALAKAEGLVLTFGEEFQKVPGLVINPADGSES